MGKGIGTDSTISSVGTGALSLGHDKIVSTVPTECFLLKDNFPGTYGAPLVSPRICMPGPGQLVLDQTDGQFWIAANEFIWPPQATPAWGDQDWHALQSDGDEFDRLGEEALVLKFRGMWLYDDSPLSCWFGFSLDTTPDTVANAEHTFYRAVALGAGIRCTSGGSDNALALRDLWPALGEYWQATVVLRPYSVGGLHWYPGASGVYAHGAHFFFRDESAISPHHLLAWYRQLQSRTDPLFPAFSNYDSGGVFDYVRIPCRTPDLSDPLFTPIYWDEFTEGAFSVAGPSLAMRLASTPHLHAPTYCQDPRIIYDDYDLFTHINGTSLDATTTDLAGRTWIEDLGDWDIQGNEAHVNGSFSRAYVETAISDIWCEARILLATNALPQGLIFRKGPDTAGGENHWLYYIAAGIAGTDTWLVEVDEDTPTVRVSKDGDYVAMTRYYVTIEAEGQSITGYVDGSQVGQYLSASFNETATWHGLYSHTADTNARWDDFRIHEIRSGIMEWLDGAGSWGIQANQAIPIVGNVRGHAYVRTVTPDVWVEANLTLNVDSLDQGILVRKSADTANGHNLWAITIVANQAGADTRIMEINDGTPTVRVNVDIDRSQGTYNLRVRCDDEAITLYVDYVEEAHWGTAWFNRHTTWHGLYSEQNTTVLFDNFIILPRGTGLIRHCYDNFDDTNGTRLQSHMPLEGPDIWVEHEGVWTIVNAGGTDQYVSPDASVPAHALQECGHEHGQVWTNCRIQPNTDLQSLGITLRESEDTPGGHNLWTVSIGSGIAGIDTFLVEIENGASTVRASADVDYVAGTWYYMDVHALGQAITAYVDGAQVAQYLTASFNETASGHGLYAANHATARFDQFRITEIPALGEYDAILDSF